MKYLRIKLTDEQYARLVQDAKENRKTPEKIARNEVVFYINRLIDQDEKGCHGGWYRGHQPREPNDGDRTICGKCGLGLVKREINWRTSWVLDNTKKALHLPENKHLLMQVKQ